MSMSIVLTVNELCSCLYELGYIDSPDKREYQSITAPGNTPCQHSTSLSHQYDLYSHEVYQFGLFIR